MGCGKSNPEVQTAQQKESQSQSAAPIQILKSGAPPSDRKIIIIGTGFSGLGAAQQLLENGIQAKNLIILEGRNRIGGRVWTDHSLGVPADLGASWIHGPIDNPITQIAKGANAQMFETDDQSLLVYNDKGEEVQPEYKEYESLLKKLDKQEGQRDDVMRSLKQAIQQEDPSFLKDLINQYQVTAYAEFDSGGPIEELSAEYWQSDKKFEGNDVLFPQGYDAVTNHLASGLEIKLETVVDAITINDTGVTVNTNQGQFEGDFCVCTLPLGVLQQGSVKFEPELPSGITGAISRLQMGYVNQILIVFPQIFWDQDVQYYGYCSQIKGQYSYFINCSQFVKVPALMTFGFGNYGLELEGQTDDQIQMDVIAILKNIFGQVPEVEAIIISRWSKDPFAYGAYSFGCVGSTDEDFRAFENQVDDQLYFAGQHTSQQYRGTVHGAYLSGVREAQKILKLL